MLDPIMLNMNSVIRGRNFIGSASVFRMSVHTLVV
jgi:hypothetical protein